MNSEFENMGHTEETENLDSSYKENKTGEFDETNYIEDIARSKNYQMDYLNDVLQCEKNISNNYSIAIDEMSNKVLFKKVFSIFKDTKGIARKAYDLAFQKGWYSLETAEETKIKKELNSMKNLYKEL